MRYLIAAIVLMSLCACQFENISKQSFEFNIPIIHLDNTAEVFTTKFYLTTYNDLLIYELPYAETHTINSVLLSDTIKYEYFIFQKKSKKGFLIKSLFDSLNKSYYVDSLLKKRAFNTLNIDSTILPYVNNLNDISSSNIYENTKISFAFNDKTIYDSVYFYFDKKLKELKFTLSHKLDAVSKSKCYKVELLQPENSTVKLKLERKYRLVALEINKCDITNKTLLNEIRKKFTTQNHNKL